MAKPQFNRNLFGAKRKESAEKEFPQVTSGIYNATIQKASVAHSKGSGRLQASFGFQIVEDDPDFPSQYLWNHIGLTDKEGNDQEKGYGVFATILSILRAPDTGDIDADVESIVGTKVRIEYKAPTDDNQYDSIRIKRVITLPDGSSAVDGYKNKDVTAPEELDNNAEAIELQPGMIVEMNTGEKLEIVVMLESEDSDDGKDYLMVKPIGGSAAQMKKICLEDVIDASMPESQTGKITEERPSDTVQAASADDLDDNTAVEEEIVEEAEPAIEVGSKVSATSAKTGKGIVGTVANLDKDGLIVVHWQNDKGQTVASGCKPETVALA